MEDFASYYSVLGVSVDATPEEIKGAYRRLSRAFHPDKSSSAPPGVRQFAEDQFKQINEAYRVLNDPDLRRQYDQLLREAAPQVQSPTKTNATPSPPSPSRSPPSASAQSSWAPSNPFPTQPSTPVSNSHAAVAARIERARRLATPAMWLSLASLCGFFFSGLFFLAPVGLVFGIVALNNFTKGGDRNGSGKAMVAVVAGLLGCGASTLWIMGSALNAPRVTPGHGLTSVDPRRVVPNEHPEARKEVLFSGSSGTVSVPLSDPAPSRAVEPDPRHELLLASLQAGTVCSGSVEQLVYGAHKYSRPFEWRVISLDRQSGRIKIQELLQRWYERSWEQPMELDGRIEGATVRIEGRGWYGNTISQVFKLDESEKQLVYGQYIKPYGLYSGGDHTWTLQLPTPRTLTLDSSTERPNTLSAVTPPQTVEDEPASLANHDTQVMIAPEAPALAPSVSETLEKQPESAPEMTREKTEPAAERPSATSSERPTIEPGPGPNSPPEMSSPSEPAIAPGSAALPPSSPIRENSTVEPHTASDPLKNEPPPPAPPITLASLAAAHPYADRFEDREKDYSASADEVFAAVSRVLMKSEGKAGTFDQARRIIATDRKRHGLIGIPNYYQYYVVVSVNGEGGSRVRFKFTSCWVVMETGKYGNKGELKPEENKVFLQRRVDEFLSAVDKALTNK